MKILIIYFRYFLITVRIRVRNFILKWQAFMLKYNNFIIVVKTSPK